MRNHGNAEMCSQTGLCLFTLGKNIITADTELNKDEKSQACPLSVAGFSQKVAA